MKEVLTNNKGFSFIEAILTTVLLSTILMALITMFQNAISHTNDTDARVTATQLANEQIESVMADKTFCGYSCVATGTTTETLDDPYSMYSRQTIIYEVDSSDLTTESSGSGYKRVDVTVTWGAESYQSINVSTVLTDYSS